MSTRWVRSPVSFHLRAAVSCCAPSVSPYQWKPQWISQQDRHVHAPSKSAHAEESCLAITNGVRPMAYPHSLPDLGYDYGALEPHIDARTMEIHHSKHHAGYTNNLNAALESHPELHADSAADLVRNLNAVPDTIRGAVRNNGGGFVNHELFWRIMTPRGLVHAERRAGRGHRRGVRFRRRAEGDAHQGCRHPASGRAGAGSCRLDPRWRFAPPPTRTAP